MSLVEFAPVGRTHIPEGEIAVRLLLAVILSAVIGFERELRDRPAGLRTHMLTALASAIFAVLTFEIYHLLRQYDQSINADPIRVIEAVTAGVSFLAAGTIIRGRNQVHGLTSGASIWMAGAIGVACGVGFHVIAGIGVALALAILVVVRQIEAHWLDTK